jgi:hypothetical protein
MEHDFDLTTGNCRRCYATRESMDDDLVGKECPKFDGPHAAALYALADRRRWLANHSDLLRRFVRGGEDQLVHMTREIREIDGRIAALDATIAQLKGSS